ncbi:hypothetical protein HDV06_006813 [Boothiomyces sp. JEL0866]|nr:hypothetical protein HDV06_006813 [Boothiomyces sp. JEL0866]
MRTLLLIYSITCQIVTTRTRTRRHRTIVTSTTPAPISTSDTLIDSTVTASSSLTTDVTTTDYTTDFFNSTTTDYITITSTDYFLTETPTQILDNAPVPTLTSALPNVNSSNIDNTQSPAPASSYLFLVVGLAALAVTMALVVFVAVRSFKKNDVKALLEKVDSRQTISRHSFDAYHQSTIPRRLSSLSTLSSNPATHAARQSYLPSQAEIQAYPYQPYGYDSRMSCMYSDPRYSYAPTMDTFMYNSDPRYTYLYMNSNEPIGVQRVSSMYAPSITSMAPIAPLPLIPTANLEATLERHRQKSLISESFSQNLDNSTKEPKVNIEPVESKAADPKKSRDSMHWENVFAPTEVEPVNRPLSSFDFPPPPADPPSIFDYPPREQVIRSQSPEITEQRKFSFDYGPEVLQRHIAPLSPIQE